MNTNYDKKLLHMGSDWQNIKKKWEGNTLSILDRYIEESETELDKSRIQSMIRTVYQESCELV